MGAIGCFGCGQKHNLSECDSSKSKRGRDAFHFDLHCYKPDTWFKWVNQNNISKTTDQSRRGSNGRGRGRDAVIPAWMNDASTNRYGPS